MKAIIEKLKPFMSIIKAVFFISILVLIVVELVHLKRTISPTALQSTLTRVPLERVALIFIIGALAVLPTTGYDFVLNRILKTGRSKSYILQTSWCINTFNNLSGFGGIIDIGLRLAFYGSPDEEERDLREVTSFLPYLISGLSFISMISLVLALFRGPLEVGRLPLPYLFLFGASCYFPILYVLSGRKTRLYFGNMPRQTRLQLGLVSFFEWTCAALAFMATGNLMGVGVPLAISLPLFSLGCIVGVVSLIPGGLGSFDFIVLTGLIAQGLSKETALAWLLFYRLAYYILPFMLGIYFFIKYLGRQLKDKYRSASKEILGEIVHALVVHGIRLFGLALALSTVFFDEIKNIAWLAPFGPIGRQVVWQFPGLLLGVCFILLARVLEKQVKRGFGLTFFWLSLTLVYVNVGKISWRFSLIALVLMLGLTLIKSQLYKQQFIYSWEARTKDGLMISLLLVILFTLAGVLFPLRAQWLTGDLTPEHYLLTWKIILGLTGLIVVAYWILMRIVQNKEITFGQAFERQRYLDLLKTYGGACDAGLAFLGNKRLFWYQDQGEDRVAFQLAVRDNKCLVMGEPSGNPDDFQAATRQLIEEAKLLDYDLVFYSVGPNLTLFLHEFGFSFMKIGELARVDLERFSLAGNRGKSFRNAVNRMHKDGFSFEVVEAPHSKGLLQQLEEISDHWLKGRSEYRFSLGYFNPDYLQEAPLALVRDAQGELVAFANIMPNYQKETLSVDLMRYDEELISNGVMDYLFLSLFLYGQERGYRYFDLGMAPLSGVGQIRGSFFQERIAYLIYNFGNRLYSFEGLYRYKSKFNPIWQEHYIAFSRPSWMAYVMLDLLLEERRSK